MAQLLIELMQIQKVYNRSSDASDGFDDDYWNSTEEKKEEEKDKINLDGLTEE